MNACNVSDVVIHKTLVVLTHTSWLWLLAHVGFFIGCTLQRRVQKGIDCKQLQRKCTVLARVQFVPHAKCADIDWSWHR